mgnify:CR=1 FL=1
MNKIMIDKIGLIMAMRGEAEPIIKHYCLKKHKDFPPVTFLMNSQEDIILGLNGTCRDHQIDNIGTQAAAINTYVMATEFKPDIIINAGTAGGFVRNNASIGDAYLGEKFVYHDRRIPLPQFEEYGIGGYKGINTDKIAEDLNLKQGVVSSGNSLDETQKDREMMLKQNTSVKDMEAAAVSWICKIYDIPFISLKVVTDLVDGKDKVQDDFIKNFRIAAESLRVKSEQLIDYLRNNDLEKIFKKVS